MAGLYGAFTVADVAVTGGVPLCIMAINPPDANSRALVTEYDLSFDGTNCANTPARIDINRGTGGTFSSTTNAPYKINDPTGSLETLRFNMKKTCTVNPTLTDTIRSFRCPVFGGTIIIPNAPGQEDVIYGSATVFLYVLITAAQSVNVTCTVRYCE